MAHPILTKPLKSGKPARTIDELPLDWFYGRGVVLDVRHLDPTAAASVEELQAALEKTGHNLEPRDIVLVRTGNDRYIGSAEYFDRGPGVSAEATRWLIEQEVKVMGIDSWGWDAPLGGQAREARRTGRNGIFWAAHYVGIDKEYCHMEQLANLGRLPPAGFTVSAFPLKVKGGSAGPARVVAMLDSK